VAAKPPFDPFAGRERTVVRPNPGGRRDVPPGPDPASPPPRDDIWGVGRQFPQGGQPEPPPFQRAGPPKPPPPPSQPAPIEITAPDPATLGAIDVPEANPILRSARPLLILLGNLRVSLAQPRIPPLMDSVAEAIQRFEQELRSAGLPEQQVVSATYIMCATADDIVQNLPGAEQQIWTQYSMLSRFFQARTSGVGFFEELMRLKANPALNIDLLELMHACLSLGFEGQYRSGAGGDVMLQQIRRDLYQTIRHIRARETDEISPHWRGQEIAPRHMRQSVPVWAVAAAAAVALLGIFVLLRILLGNYSDALADGLAGLHPDDEVMIARKAYAPMPPIDTGRMTQLQRIRAALASDIKANRVAVDPYGKDILVRLLNDVVFDVGDADVRPAFKDVLGRVAATLDKEPKNIRIVGHTDNSPIRSKLKFKDNQDLSIHRAAAVAAIMKPRLKDPGRLETDGRGSDEPVASNKSPAGRAKNRRVDILLPRTD
jgi:type VI secretion system protein ImpK